MSIFKFDTANPPDFSPADAAKVILALPLRESSTMIDRSGETIPRPSRELALHLADLFSHEEAQSFYHLAVLVTRLK